MCIKYQSNFICIAHSIQQLQLNALYTNKTKKRKG
uniref:Uncharacterized protein n=1 Tax=Anguilla anguilla TaxID=7936 RepID=A0A0E9S1B4_ANGAN